jgi:hypothetical protein
MECGECQRLAGAFIETMIFADKAETSLRAYFMTHLHGGTVSEMAEYQSLKQLQQRMAMERDKAYMDMVDHQKSHEGTGGAAYPARGGDTVSKSRQI